MWDRHILMISPVFPYPDVTRFTTKSWRESCDSVTECRKYGAAYNPSSPVRGRKAAVPVPLHLPFRERRARRAAELTLAGAVALSVIVTPGLIRGHGPRTNQAGAARHHVVQRSHPFDTRPWLRWPCRRLAPSDPVAPVTVSDEQAFRHRWTVSPTFRMSVAYANATPAERPRSWPTSPPHRPPPPAPPAPAGPERGRPAAAAPVASAPAPAVPGRIGVGSHRRLRVRRQLGRQHRQRLLGWAPVQPVHLARLRRRAFAALRLAGQPRAADRRGRAHPRRPGQLPGLAGLRVAAA